MELSKGFITKHSKCTAGVINTCRFTALFTCVSLNLAKFNGRVVVFRQFQLIFGRGAGIE